MPPAGRSRGIRLEYRLHTHVINRLLAAYEVAYRGAVLDPLDNLCYLWVSVVVVSRRRYWNAEIFIPPRKLHGSRYASVSYIPTPVNMVTLPDGS